MYGNLNRLIRVFINVCVCMNREYYRFGECLELQHTPLTSMLFIFTLKSVRITPVDFFSRKVLICASRESVFRLIICLIMPPKFARPSPV